MPARPTRQTDGHWEHGHGIRIGTLDNPGWRLSIDLEETELKERPFAPVRIERTETDWVHCRVEARVFRGAGGPHNLRELIDQFLRWADGSS